MYVFPSTNSWTRPSPPPPPCPHSEDSLIRYAEQFARATGRPVVVLFDRGLLDPRAFISEAEYEALLRSTDMTWDDVGKGRGPGVPPSDPPPPVGSGRDHCCQEGVDGRESTPFSGIFARPTGDASDCILLDWLWWTCASQLNMTKQSPSQWLTQGGD